MRPAKTVAVIGAGMGGLAAAADLARQGLDVTVLERAAAPGGKARMVPAGAARVSGGPTVFTMRWIFEQLFSDCGSSLEGALKLSRPNLLARHGWREGGHWTFMPTSTSPPTPSVRLQARKMRKAIAISVPAAVPSMKRWSTASSPPSSHPRQNWFAKSGSPTSGP
jgi:phytoene dehydrogenase-like protein